MGKGLISVVICAVVACAGSSGSGSFRYNKSALEGVLKSLSIPPVSILHYDITIPINFTLGLLYGLEVNQQNTGQCFFQWGNVVVPLARVVEDVDDLVQGQGNLLELVSDFSQFVENFNATESVCDYGALLQVLESLGTVAGWDQILSNLVAHFSAITASAKAFSVCTQQFQCGEDLGNIIRFLLGWGINYHPRIQTWQGNANDFFLGIIAGLELSQNSADQCVTDLYSLSGLLNQTEKDLSKLVAGDIAVSFSVVEDLQSLLSSLQNYSPDCNLEVLGSIFAGLLSAQGIAQVATNFSDNISQILSAETGFLTCSQDPYVCGNSAGTTFRLVFGWGI